MSEEIWEPTIEEKADGYVVTGRGRVFPTRAPRDIGRYDSELIGTQVRINGRVRTIKGIERYPRMNPIIPKGELIGLLVDDA